jgi:hypothetical protein
VGIRLYIRQRESIPPSLTQVFPIAIPAHCCNHICDNLTTNFGNKCKPLFSACAKAKTKGAYEKALLELWRYKVAASE